MMIQPNQQKVEETSSEEEAALFNSDTLSKIISFLPSVNLLSLSLTCKGFGIPVSNNPLELSLIEESARIAVKDIATEEQLAALPHYDGESSLADYHYLQLMREPLTFDQLCAGVKYVNSGDKTSVMHSGDRNSTWGTAFSNNIMRAGKHYVSFVFDSIYNNIYVGVMRPGQANQNAKGSPIHKDFFQHFSRTHVEHYNGSVLHCCLYGAYDGKCYTRDWDSDIAARGSWDGLESASSSDELGLLLDLDEGSLSVYKNGRKLGVMKKGLAGNYCLAGPYCWVVSMVPEVTNVTIKRGVIPPG